MILTGVFMKVTRILDEFELLVLVDIECEAGAVVKGVVICSEHVEVVAVYVSDRDEMIVDEGIAIDLDVIVE